MARGRSGVISKEYKGEENTAYHDVIKLFKIYRAVNWQMQIKINQVKRRFHMEYGTDVDEFLESIYQAGMDVERDLASEKERVEAINRSNQYLRLIDEAVDLMRRYHPQGERYYWVLYYSYLSSTKPENIDEILDKLELHFPQYARVHRTTYFRWREQAFDPGPCPGSTPNAKQDGKIISPARKATSVSRRQILIVSPVRVRSLPM